MHKKALYGLWTVMFLAAGGIFSDGTAAAEVNAVTVTGRIMGTISESPVGEMSMNLWNGKTMEIDIGKTNADGTFSVTFDMNEVRNADRGDGQSNYYYRLSKDCFISVDILVQKRWDAWVVSIPQKYENIAEAKPIRSNIDFGDIPSNSMIGLTLNSDTPVQFTYTWKYRHPELERKYGMGWKTSQYDSIFQKSKERDQYLSPNSYVKIRVQDTNGKVFPSPIYSLGAEVCGVLDLTFRNGKFSSNLPIAEGIVEGPFDDGSVLLPVYKGWNLLPMTAVDPMDRGSVNSASIKAVYLYLTPLKQLIQYRVDTRNDETMKEEMTRLGIDENWFRSRPFVFANAGGWFYSAKSGDIAVSMNRDGMGGNFLGMDLYAGWNFKTVTPDLAGKKIRDMNGNCLIEKVATWDGADQRWVVDTYNEIGNEPFDDHMYEVMIVKVKADCSLGAEGSSPPPLPPRS